MEALLLLSVHTCSLSQYKCNFLCCSVHERFLDWQLYSKTWSWAVPWGSVETKTEDDADPGWL